jgi:hypothetical protein
MKMLISYCKSTIYEKLTIDEKRLCVSRFADKPVKRENNLRVGSRKIGQQLNNITH